MKKESQVIVEKILKKLEEDHEFVLSKKDKDKILNPY